MISTYSELQAAVIDWSNRSDMSARVPDFIALCESDMQVRCKLLEFEATGTIVITAGVGTLPTGFTGLRSAYWDGDLTRPLRYITPDLYDEKANIIGMGLWYTTTGTSIKVAPVTDGNVVATYKARFVPLATTPTNVILTNYPDAYLQGTLVQLHAFTGNDKKLATASALYEGAIDRIKIDNRDRKWAGSVEVRAR